MTQQGQLLVLRFYWGERNLCRLVTPQPTEKKTAPEDNNASEDPEQTSPHSQHSEEKQLLLRRVSLD